MGRPMGGIWASNNKSRASITLIIKFRDSPERGGHFEESPTEILQRMRFYKERDSTKNEILQNEEGTLKKARSRIYTIGALRPMGGLWASSNKSRAPFTLIIKFRDSPERGGHFEESPTEILQRPRFYKDRDSTKTEILQRRRFYKERDSTKNEILQRTRFSTIGALRPMGGIWASNNKSRASVTLIIKFTGADSSPSKSSNSQHRIHRAWTLCLTRCTRCTSEATKKRE